MDDDDDYEVIPFSGNLEELPEMIAKIISRSLAAKPNVLKPHDPISDRLMPSRAQLELGPGDLCLLAAAEQDPDERTYQLAQLLDPIDYADQYPDWEERVVVRTYLFGRWYDGENDLGGLGWFPRVRLIKLDQWQWDQVMAHIRGKKPLEVPCRWMLQLFSEAVIGVADANPDVPMSRPLPCGTCGSLTVVARLFKSMDTEGVFGTFSNTPGKNPRDIYMGNTLYFKEEERAWLRCISCGASVELDAENMEVVTSDD